MFTPFIICVREGLEIFLVIIPLVMYFNQNKLYDMTKSAVKGGIIGAAAAIAIAAFLFSQAALLNGTASQLFDGFLGIFLAGLVLYSIVLLRKSKAFSTELNPKFIALSRTGVLLISAITFFRELLEATLFILTSNSTSPLLVVLASGAGLACSAIIVYAVSRGFTNLNINMVFYLLNLFLVGLGAYYFGDGLDALLGDQIPRIFTLGILLYAVPSYYLMIKKDLRNLINSNRIR